MVRSQIGRTTEIATPTAQTYLPSVVVKTGRLHLQQHVRYPCINSAALQPLHHLKQNLVAVLVPEDIYDLFGSQPQQGIVYSAVCPVD